MQCSLQCYKGASSLVRGRKRCKVLSLHKALDAKPSHTLTSPEETTMECLTLLRRPDSIAHLVLRPPVEQATQHVQLGHLEVEERGPLTEYARHTLDASARRTLPCHLLRRCRILSSLKLGDDTCHQRVAITACSGAESAFAWKLVRCGSAAAAAAAAVRAQGSTFQDDVVSNRSSKGLIDSLGKHFEWLVDTVSYCRDACIIEEGKQGPALQPQPRLAPEAVIQAQLRCLQQGDLQGAERFNSSHSLQYEQDAVSMRSLIRQPQCHSLLTHETCILGKAALPREGVFMQCVHLSGGSLLGESALFIWQLSLHSDDRWRVDSINLSKPS